MELSELVYIDDSGYHFADYPAFLAWLQDGYRQIYGADIYIEADSQDGQFIAILAKAFYDSAALGASVYNSFSPVTAQGVGLSRNVKINGITRREATISTADLTIVGTAGTVITDGVAKDTLEQKWDLPVSVTIPLAGTIVVTATAQDVGNVNAEANTINQIFTPTLGWQSVNNLAAATPGVAAETDAELRIRQADSTSIPAETVFDATWGGIANVEGVTKVRGYENDTGSTDSNGIPAHTISFVVEGGDSVDIAQTIQIYKTPGVGTYGTTTETVTDSKGMPLEIKFYRPTAVPITVDIAIDVLTDGWTSDYEDLIKEAVAAYINAIGIGNDVITTKLFIPAYLVGTPAYGTYDITSLEINGGTANVNVDFNKLATCDVADITITT